MSFKRIVPIDEGCNITNVYVAIKCSYKAEQS